jgi:aspartyl-tRNA(Asn)/glutamyl-tRNA(Gln) amidotransferase subunit A
MSLIKLRKKLDSKEIGAVELTKEYLKKIKEKDTEINSFITVTEDIALENAKNAQNFRIII